MKSFSIPRGVAVVAGGEILQTNSHLVFSVKAGKNESDWPIIESPFMAGQASTQEYQFVMTLEGDSLSYSQKMQLAIYGKEFLHKDNNHLLRVND